MHIPEGSVNNIGIARVEDEIHRAGLYAAGIDLLPCLATVSGTEDSALFVWSPQMAECGHVDDVGIFGMNAYCADVEGVFQTDVLPGFARVGRFINAVAMGGVAADIRLTHADVDDIRVGLRDSDGAHGSGFELAVGDGQPAGAAVGSFPDPAAGGAEVIHIRLRGDARDSVHAAATERADAAVLEFLERI